MSDLDLNLQKPTLSIIVPAYNEEKRLPETLERLARFVQPFGAPWYRLLMSNTWRVLASLVVVRGFCDTQCGFKAYRAEVAQQVLKHTLLYNSPAQSLNTASVAAAADVEMLYVARRLGYKVAEVPLKWQHYDESKIRPMQDSLKAFGDLVRIRVFALEGRYKADGKSA